MKDYEAAGITEVIKFANDVLTRVGNLYDENRQQPL